MKQRNNHQITKIIKENDILVIAITMVIHYQRRFRIEYDTTHSRKKVGM
jgi:hypothetical protein